MHSFFSGDGGWQLRDADVEKKGCQDVYTVCGTVFLRCRNVCQCDVEAAIANQLHDQVDHHAPVRQQQQLARASCFKCSDWHYKRGCLVHNSLFLLHSW